MLGHWLAGWPWLLSPGALSLARGLRTRHARFSAIFGMRLSLSLVRGGRPALFSPRAPRTVHKLLLHRLLLRRVQLIVLLVLTTVNGGINPRHHQMVVP